MLLSWVREVMGVVPTKGETVYGAVLAGIQNGGEAARSTGSTFFRRSRRQGHRTTSCPPIKGTSLDIELAKHTTFSCTRRAPALICCLNFDWTYCVPFSFSFSLLEWKPFSCSLPSFISRHK